MSRPLSLKQREFVSALAAGANGVEAAVKAGYGPKSAKHMACRLKKNERVRAELRKIEERVRQMAVYDVTAAMAEARQAMVLAEKHKQMTAYVKAVEHRARLSGLMTEKVELNVNQTIDIGAALQEARARVAGQQGNGQLLVIEGRARDVSARRDIGSSRPMRDLPTGLARQAQGASGRETARPTDTQSVAVPESGDASVSAASGTAGDDAHDDMDAFG